ncbi:Hypothetical protein RG540_CH19130 [Neorhizobium galegae bv. orientalis str. HAMBI 540]|uniref:Uncharacterized protein n=1 Tax=Neorhizobium galegae bv. orientalis str. HAMBI 540 TaxID=1028800 RepID=A0A068SP55_NEOGA|nr:Hypothetical protein RG540_CH19130 [Neorhizobium galegae bv. orientalis str. HAMBI 540]
MALEADNAAQTRWEKPLQCGAEGATAPETLRQKDQQSTDRNSGERPEEGPPKG